MSASSLASLSLITRPSMRWSSLSTSACAVWIHSSIVSATASRRPGTCSSTCSCSAGRAVGEEHVLAAAELVGEHRLELAEHVELRCRASRGRSCSARSGRSSGTSCRRGRPAGRRCRCRGSSRNSVCSGGQSSPTTLDQLHGREEAGGVARNGVAEPPSRSSRRPQGVSTVSMATEPTTRSDIE